MKMNQRKKQRIFAKTIEPEYGYIFQLIYHNLDQNQELAHSVTQDVMELAWDRIHQLPKTGSARSWLTQIASEEIRKCYRAQGITGRELDWELSENPAEIPTNAQAPGNHDSQSICAPAPLDRSFMEPRATKKTKHRYLKWIVAVTTTVILLIAACLTLGAAIFGQDAINTYRTLLGFETEEPEDQLLEQITSTKKLEITDQRDIEKAVDFLDGNLYMPTYLPEGFTFEHLIAEKANDGLVSAECTFRKGNRTLQIIEFLAIDDEDSQLSGGANGELIRLEDRVLYITEGAVSGEVSIAAITEDALCAIEGGHITRDEGIKIAKGMKILSVK